MTGFFVLMARSVAVEADPALIAHIIAALFLFVRLVLYVARFCRAICFAVVAFTVYDSTALALIGYWSELDGCCGDPLRG